MPARLSRADPLRRRWRCSRVASRTAP